MPSWRPVTGYVAERSVQLGQHIQAGQALMTVIPLNSLWVDANFKEVQLRHLRIGQPAEVRSDLYGGSFIFHGHVQGMSAGTGAAFSLLPAQNASGNWIKVVQRVPVRIRIDDADLVKSPLRVGLSATVTVETTASRRAGARHAGRATRRWATRRSTPRISTRPMPKPMRSCAAISGQAKIASRGGAHG